MRLSLKSNHDQTKTTSPTPHQTCYPHRFLVPPTIRVQEIYTEQSRVREFKERALSVCQKLTFTFGMVLPEPRSKQTSYLRIQEVQIDRVMENLEEIDPLMD